MWTYWTWFSTSCATSEEIFSPALAKSKSLSTRDKGKTPINLNDDDDEGSGDSEEPHVAVTEEDFYMTPSESRFPNKTRSTSTNRKGDGSMSTASKRPNTTLHTAYEIMRMNQIEVQGPTFEDKVYVTVKELPQVTSKGRRYFVDAIRYLGQGNNGKMFMAIEDPLKRWYYIEGGLQPGILLQVIAIDLFSIRMRMRLHRLCSSLVKCGRLRKSLEKLRPPSETEILLSDNGDLILEGSVTNFFVVRLKENCEVNGKSLHGDGSLHSYELQTAPVSDGVLPGVIRQLVIEICWSKGISIREVSPSSGERDSWEEAFITSLRASAKEARAAPELERVIEY